MLLCGSLKTFQVLNCPYRAKTKGKVERFARFVKENFYYPLRAKLKNTGIEITVELLNTYSFSWLETINSRIHGTTGKRPAEMFAEEKKYLMPLVDYKPIYEIPEIYRHRMYNTKNTELKFLFSPTKKSGRYFLLNY